MLSRQKNEQTPLRTVEMQGHPSWSISEGQINPFLARDSVRA